jgi:hypothetical protein
MRLSSETRARLRRVKTLNTGGGLRECKVALFMYSPSIDIPQLTKVLGCAPTHAVAKGQLRHPPHGSGPSPVGLWSLEAPKALGFVEKIQYLLEATPKKLTTWRRLSKSHDVRLNCGIFLHSWNEGFDVPAHTVAEIGARGWKLGVDIYSAEGDEIINAFLSRPPRARGQ